MNIAAKRGNLKYAKVDVLSNETAIKEIERPGARSIKAGRIIWLNAPDIAKYAKPGQFVMLRCGDSTLPRPLGIHQVKEDRLALFYTVWEGGRGTEWLSNQAAGATIDVFGPLGNGFTIQPEAKRLLLVAGGMGLAPLVFLTQEAMKTGHPVTLLYGTADKARYPWRLLPSGFELVEITEDGSLGKQGKATDFIAPYSHFIDQVFACGPLPMYRELISSREKLGLSDKPIQVSLEVRMGCGRGVCYSCTVKTKSGLKQVCKDGPVFNLDDLDENELPAV
jgi:dihydroorotate dehydrogenase electron transfer subunit